MSARSVSVARSWSSPAGVREAGGVSGVGQVPGGLRGAAGVEQPGSPGVERGDEPSLGRPTGEADRPGRDLPVLCARRPRRGDRRDRGHRNVRRYQSRRGLLLARSGRSDRRLRLFGLYLGGLLSPGSGLSTLEPVRYFSPRTLRGSESLNGRTTQALCNSGIIGGGIGFGAALAQGPGANSKQWWPTPMVGRLRARRKTSQERSWRGLP